MSDDLISNEMFEEEKVDKVRTSSAEIVVHGTKEKPYYEIEYFDLSDNEMHVGFSSYKLDVVFGYLEKYFEIMDNKEELDQMQDYHIGDLISRKETLETVKRLIRAGLPEEAIYDGIAGISTSFDKEKVIDELTWNENALEPGVAKGLLIALEIVEKGGIE